MAKKTAAQNTTLPAQIEIFRAGTHTSDDGSQHTFSEADLQAMADAYNPAVSEAPLVVGHPKTNNPAFGWVDKLHVKDGVLLMDTKDVQPAFAEMVRSKRFKKRSASFYPPKHPGNPKPGQFHLRHVGFLGAQPPAVKGLADIPDFTDDDSCPCFSEAVSDAVPVDNDSAANPATDLPPQPTQTTEPEEDDDMSEQLKEELAKAQAKREELEAEKAALEEKIAKERERAAKAEKEAKNYAESIKKQRDAEIASFAEAQIKAGKMTPAEQPVVTALLTGAADMEPVSFGEGSGKKDTAPAEFLKGLIASRQPVVDFGEVAVGALAAPSAANMSDEELDKKAQAYAAQHNVSYSEALDKVAAFTQ